MFRIVINQSQVNDIENGIMPPFFNMFLENVPHQRNIHYTSEGIILNCFDNHVRSSLWRYVDSPSELKHLYFHRVTFNNLFITLLGTSFDMETHDRIVDLDDTMFYEILEAKCMDGYLESGKKKRLDKVRSACDYVFDRVTRNSKHYDYIVSCISNALELIRKFPRLDIKVVPENEKDFKIVQKDFINEY